MIRTIAVSSQFVDATTGSTWVEGDCEYVLGHPDWFAVFNAEAPKHGGKALDQICNLDLSENAARRAEVFDSWRRWNANKLRD